MVAEVAVVCGEDRMRDGLFAACDGTMHLLEAPRPPLFHETACVPQSRPHTTRPRPPFSAAQRDGDGGWGWRMRG